MHQLKKKIENFRNEIFRNKIQHNKEAYCIKNMCQQNPSYGREPNICNGGCGGTKNDAKLESAGRDQIAKYRLKQLTATHIYLATFFNRVTNTEFASNRCNNSHFREWKHSKTKDLQTCNMPAQNIQNQNVYHKEMNTTVY